MEREKLIDNLLTFVPSMYKRLMKGFPTPDISEISKQQLALLFHISKDNERLMSHYSEKMMVPKSNLTIMADKLIEEGLIERIYDPNDRRTIILKITDKGEKFIEEYKEKVKKEMMKKLDLLDDEDIKRLNMLIDEMKVIFNKMV